MSREAEPEEEMTELPRQEMNTALLDNLEDERTTPPKKRDLKIRDWMRQLRLQILLIRIGRPSSLKNSAERRKVAIYHSRRLAILHVLLHLIPLGGAMALLYLQWLSFFLSFTSPADSTVLQFVAKFHELLMQVSIVGITVYIIRTEALRNFVPLGALSGIARATTALVGPSSAVLMTPRSGSARDAGAFTFYTNASYEQLFPSTIGRANDLQFNWKTIGTSLEYDLRKRSSVDNNTVVEIVSEYGSPDALPGLPRPVRSRVNLTLESAFKSPDVGISNATVPTGFIRQGFNELSFRGVSIGGKLIGNYTLSVYAPQPVVQVICSTTSKKSWKLDAEVIYVQDYTLRTATISTLGMLTQKLNDSGEMFVNDGSTTIQSFEPVWMAAPEPGSQAWIGIFFQHV
ncbi:hypothetical protein AA0118_g12286 [Alternaria tenuissima]|nr:hypothetical protein AA0118_g12286 [Alternaria tenuissima]